MKAWQLHRFGLSNLTQDEVPVPGVGLNDVLMKVGAVALNFRDRAIVEGFYDPDILKNGPFIMGGDVAGTVVKTGAAVTRFQVGDKITSHLYSKWLDGSVGLNAGDTLFGGPLPGGLAEYMLLNEQSAVRAPSYLSDVEASTFPIAGLTAWFALTNFSPRQRGDTILVQGTGGVSIFAIQIASAMGVKVIATTSSDEKGVRAEKLGATHIINYLKTPSWDEAVLDLTNGRGVDQVLEVVGGDKSLNQSIRATRSEGLITIIGFLVSPTAKIDLIPMLYRQSRLQGTAVGHRKAFEAMNAFLENHPIEPVIDSVYSFENSLDAFRQLEKGAFGKIVIRVGNQ